MLIKYFSSTSSEVHMAQSKGKLVIYTLLLLVLFFSVINILVSLSGRAFSLELLGLIVLLFLTLLGFVGYAKGWGERSFFIVFLLFLVNLVLMWYFLDSLYVVLLLITLAGFMMSVPTRRRQRKRAKRASSLASPGPYSEVFDSVAPTKPLTSKPSSSSFSESIPAVEVYHDSPSSGDAPEASSEAKGSAVSAKFSPGKYVASKNSNNYHEPKCDWAKKIAKVRRVWFATKEEAWEKGYKAHSCVGK